MITKEIEIKDIKSKNQLINLAKGISEDNLYGLLYDSLKSYDENLNKLEIMTKNAKILAKRIDKAIEYIKIMYIPLEYISQKEELLDILEGKDE